MFHKRVSRRHHVIMLEQQSQNKAATRQTCHLLVDLENPALNLWGSGDSFLTTIIKRVISKMFVHHVARILHESINKWLYHCLLEPCISELSGLVKWLTHILDIYIFVNPIFLPVSANNSLWIFFDLSDPHFSHKNWNQKVSMCPI